MGERYLRFAVCSPPGTLSYPEPSRCNSGVRNHLDLLLSASWISALRRQRSQVRILSGAPTFPMLTWIQEKREGEVEALWKQLVKSRVRNRPPGCRARTPQPHSIEPALFGRLEAAMASYRSCVRSKTNAGLPVREALSWIRSVPPMWSRRSFPLSFSRRLMLNNTVKGVSPGS